MGRPLGGREWDEVLGSVRELTEGVYATVVFPCLGGLIGLGAARLLDIRGGVGVTAGGGNNLGANAAFRVGVSLTGKASTTGSSL